ALPAPPAEPHIRQEQSRTGPVQVCGPSRLPPDASVIRRATGVPRSSGAENEKVVTADAIPITGGGRLLRQWTLRSDATGTSVADAFGPFRRIRYRSGSAGIFSPRVGDD